MHAIEEKLKSESGSGKRGRVDKQTLWLDFGEADDLLFLSAESSIFSQLSKVLWSARYNIIT